MTTDTTLDDFRRAQAFFDADQPAEAARLLDAVVAASPGSTAALELRARALFASAQLGRAEQAFRELAAGAPADPVRAQERSTRARTSLVASLRSAAEAHRRAARTHLGAADLGSGDVQGHRTEAQLHLARADEDDARARAVETDAAAPATGVSD